MSFHVVFKDVDDVDFEFYDKSTCSKKIFNASDAGVARDAKALKTLLIASFAVLATFALSCFEFHMDS